MDMFLDRQKLKRDALKFLLAPWLRWSPLERPRDGFSIILGVPWALRHLLPVNLQFVEGTDIRQLQRLFIVFDRIAQEGADAFIGGIRAKFPGLPLAFSFHPPVAGRIVEWIDQSKFYASTNWTMGLAQCETRYAVLHDFDLYPLVPHYFTSMIETLREKKLRFTGAEWTLFDGLEASDALIGTWALGIDVEWLRSRYRPIECFHAVEQVSGRRFDLDAFTYIESMTPERQLTPTIDSTSMAHVRNLCSTYLRFSKGEKFDVVWRLHLMWYLEALCGREGRLDELVKVMEGASSGRLTVDGRTADFSATHVTCANVLRKEIVPMEKFLFGKLRVEVSAYIDAFERFLSRNGNSNVLYEAEGSVRWAPDVVQGGSQSSADGRIG